MLATDYIDSLRDAKGNVPVILNKGYCNSERYLLLRLSADLAKWLYVTPGMGVYYTRVVRTINKENVFGAIEIFAEDFPNIRKDGCW